MALNELNPSFSEDSTPKSGICAWCKKNAEMHLSLFGEIPHLTGNFCLACGEAFIHELRKLSAPSLPTEEATNLLSGFKNSDILAKSSSAGEPPFDEIEGGIIFWEGQGWSSDGPFAGA